MNQSQLLVYSVMLMRKKFITVFERENRSFGITAAEGLMLKYIYLEDSLTVTELSKKAGYNKSMVTKNMKNLIASGYATSEALDGRTVAIKITPKGKEFIKAADINGEVFANEVFADCTPEEREKFFEILMKLRYSEDVHKYDNTKV